MDLKRLVLAPFVALGQLAGCPQERGAPPPPPLDPPAQTARAAPPASPALAQARLATATAGPASGDAPASLERTKAGAARAFEGAGATADLRFARVEPADRHEALKSWKGRMLRNGDLRQRDAAARLRGCLREGRLGPERPDPETVHGLDALHGLGLAVERERAAGRKDRCDAAFGYWSRLVDLAGFAPGVEAADQLDEAYLRLGALYAEAAGPADRDPSSAARAVEWLRLVRDARRVERAAPILARMKGLLAEHECVVARFNLHQAGRDPRRLEAVRRRAEKILADYPGAGQDACARELLSATGG